MTAKEAGGFIIRFGKFKGRSVEQIAADDEGLRYLDWTVGQDWCFPDAKEAIRVYLAQPTIQRELADLIGDNE